MVAETGRRISAAPWAGGTGTSTGGGGTRPGIAGMVVGSGARFPNRQGGDGSGGGGSAGGGADLTGAGGSSAAGGSGAGSAGGGSTATGSATGAT